MASLKISDLLNNMAAAAKKSLAKKWPEIQNLATSSFKALAQNLVDIEAMRQEPSPSISEEQANLLIGMQKNTVKMVLLSEEGLGLLAAEAAINAALDSIKDVVNKAIGFAIL
ncbi:MAG: hypothetical protein M3Z92_10280 [Bacteroidota bacterium]|nr:hypothetical protein [Bacteroidota bacterium]